VSGAPAAAAPVPAVAAAPERVPWVAVLVFTVLAIGLAWLVDLPLWLSGQGLATPGAIVLIALSMYAPGVAALIVAVAVQRTPWRQVLPRLGWWPLRPVARTIWFVVIGLVGSALLPILAVLLAAAFGMIQLDLAGFSGLAATLSAQLPAGTQLPIPIQLLALLQLLQIPIAAFINGFFTIGEETGWRGFLLPALRPLGTWPALVLTGALWGLWHAPIILLGYDFGRPDALGLVLMILGCTAYGTFIGWLRIRSASIWPSVIAHGAFNAAGGFAAVVIAAGTTADPAAVGPLGWAAWILLAAVAIVLTLTRQVPAKRDWAVPGVRARA